jgi:hypothetical protein
VPGCAGLSCCWLEPIGLGNCQAIDIYRAIQTKDNHPGASLVSLAATFLNCTPIESVG